MIIQPIVNIAEICSRHEIDQAVICPGSRSAPIALAFARHPKIKTFVIPDERSAGFIALGLAQSSTKPVVVVCTSGTSVANLYPSIIEAFYQHVPLVVLTADRPPEWIDQQDGQTIRQQNIFQHHVLESCQFPVSFDHDEAKWHGEKMISEVIVKATGQVQGPVHVNIPIREPFYPSPEEEYHYTSHVKIIKSTNAKLQPSNGWSQGLIDELKNYSKIMVVVGQARITSQLKNCLSTIQKNLKWVIIGDITANLDFPGHSISRHDIILQDTSDAAYLFPDLLITFGQSVLSKGLKTFLRDEQVENHWHVGFEHNTADAFKSLTQKIELNPEIFFDVVEKQVKHVNKSQNSYFNHWVEKDLQVGSFVEDFFTTDNFSEFHAVHTLMKQLPANCHLHLANSMPVRYANYVGLEKQHNITIWSNRGTSGIDGCLSAAVGHAINTQKINTLLIGDLAFFYDRNGLWHNNLPNNLRIIVLNNHGGGIFRLINGPKQLDELEEFFETHQKLDTANTARDFAMKYFNVKSLKVLPDTLEKFFDKNTGASILEIETEPKINQQVYEDFKHKAFKLWK